MPFPKAYLKDIWIEVTYSLSGKSVVTWFPSCPAVSICRRLKSFVEFSLLNSIFLYGKLGERFFPGFYFREEKYETAIWKIGAWGVSLCYWDRKLFLSFITWSIFIFNNNWTLMFKHCRLVLGKTCIVISHFPFSICFFLLVLLIICLCVWK